MKHTYCAEYKNVRIRPLRHGDIEKLREWRNNASISRFLAPMNEITTEMQNKWFYNYLSDMDQFIFAIEETETLHRVVGSVAIYGFNGTSAEVGKIVVGDPEAKGRKIGSIALLLAIEVGFEKMGIDTYIGDVHDENIPAKTNDLKAGFIVTGRHEFISGGIELEIKLSRERFEEINPFTKEFILYSEED